jgi:hypothetical protein
MLKILVYEDDLILLSKMKAVLTSVSLFQEIKMANDEKTCLGLIKEELFDIYILRMNNEKFKDLLLKVLPALLSKPILSTDASLDLSIFDQCIQMDLVKEHFSVVSFLSSLTDLIPRPAFDVQKPLLEEYIPINFSVLRKIKNTPCDIYIKLGQEKFIKIVNLGEEVQRFFLDRFENKNVREFYVHKTDFYRCSDALFGNTFPIIEQFETSEEYFIESEKVIHEFIKELGLNENVLSVANELVTSAIAELKDPQLLSLLNKFKNSKDRYIYDHSLMTAIFAVSICEKFEWRNRQVLQKIAFAAFFHDFAFTDNKLAMIEVVGGEYQHLSKLQKKEILGHTEKMVELLSQNKSVSSEVLSIIGKHHEASGEQSYPLGLSSANLSILECIFIVSHKFTSEIYKIAFRADKLPKAVESVLSFSNTGNLKQVRPIFESLFS